MEYPFNRAAQYAIRALVHLAGLEPGVAARQSEVAEAIRAPLPYLSKLLAQLTRAGLIQARRGPHGGVRLGRAPESIRLAQIVSAVEGDTIPTGCVLGPDHCDEANPCPVRPIWSRVRRILVSELEQKTLAEMVVHHAGEAQELATAGATA